MIRDRTNHDRPFDILIVGLLGLSGSEHLRSGKQEGTQANPPVLGGQ